MKLEKLSLSPYSSIHLVPALEIPSRIAKFYSCVDKRDVLNLIASYMRDYGKYWWDALLDDTFSLVSQTSVSSKYEEMLIDSIILKLKQLKRGIVSVWNILTLASLGVLPKVTSSTKVFTEVSFEIHVRKAYEERLIQYLKECLNMP